MSEAYVYPGTQNDFYNEFGGLPDRTVKPENIFLIFLILIIVVIIILIIALALSRTFITYTTHKGTVNLSNLKDLNNTTVECCVFPGDTAPNEQYIYDAATNITYSRQIPFSINNVCSTFSNPTSCRATNTDASGNIIPVATFHAAPYYTFEQGLFVQCASTTICP